MSSGSGSSSGAVASSSAALVGDGAKRMPKQTARSGAADFGAAALLRLGREDCALSNLGVGAAPVSECVADYTQASPSSPSVFGGSGGSVGSLLDGPGPISLLVSDIRTSGKIKCGGSEKPRYYCERSRFTLAGPGEVPGSTRLVLASCKANSCPYCGRVKMYRKRNRLYQRFAADRASVGASASSYEFVTTTLREGAFSAEQSFEWLKPAMSYAIKQVRRARVYNKRYRRSAWSGCDLAYINDVDIHPGNGRPHIHALHSLSLSGASGKKRGARGRLLRRLVKELHYYLNCFLRRRLGLSVLRWREGEAYPFTGENSLAYVHISGAREDGSRGDEASGVRSAENVAMYMALHNGKIWTDGREYPRRYRRFSTSRGFLPAEAKKEGPSAWVFVQNSLAGVVGKLQAQGVAVGPSALADVGHDGADLSRLALADFDSYRMRQALGLVAGENEPEQLNVVPLLEEAAAKMQRLQDYWDSGADLDGGRVQQVVNELRPGMFGPPSVSSVFVPGVTFEAWDGGAAPLSLVASAGAGSVAPASARISASSVTERDADIAELLFLCPSLSEPDAACWVDDVARIKARKQARECRLASVAGGSFSEARSGSEKETGAGGR